ncbi:hypothetical protein RNH99_30395, partial [Pseudomonas paraeruginosa]|uniref:hypothetical protein n=1 Tax=Pseudomonas paraeruginosa TaxID=2994495 RepID=UPI002883841C
ECFFVYPPQQKLGLCQHGTVVPNYARMQWYFSACGKARSQSSDLNATNRTGELSTANHTICSQVNGRIAGT